MSPHDPDRLEDLQTPVHIGPLEGCSHCCGDVNRENSEHEGFSARRLEISKNQVGAGVDQFQNTKLYTSLV